MGQGVYIHVGNGARRPRTVRELAEAVTTDPKGVVLERDSAPVPNGQITRPDTWHGFTKGRNAYTATISGPEPGNEKWTATLKVRFNPQFTAIVNAT